MENTYCKYCLDLPDGNVNKVYHNTQYGFPIDEDNALFGRLILEINQAGLSWSTILNKQDNFVKAYDDFSITTIAAYKEKDIERLLSDAGIIRNKLKINAVIYNANVVVSMQQEFGSFKNWIDLNHPLSRDEWVKLFKKKFKFTGGEITNEFLMSTGYLPGAHSPECPTFKEIELLGPKFLEVIKHID